MPLTPIQQRSKPFQKPVEGLDLPRPASACHNAKWVGVRDQLADVVEHSNDAIFSRTFDGTITTWNAAARRIFGFTTDEIVGRSSRVLLPRGHKDEFRRLVMQMRRGQVVEHFETERMRKDGRRIHASLTLSPIRDVSGRLVGFSTIARDITAQHQMRDALARHERELEDLFDEASVGLALVTRHGKVLRANRALADMVDRPVSRVVNCSLKTFHSNTTLLKDTLNRLAQRQTFHNFPMALLTRKGETKHVLVDANGFWEKGNFVHSRWFIRDISQRKRLERELLEIGERERRRLAQDLHDGLGQQLGGIAYLSNVLRERLLEGGAPEAANAARISGLMRSAIEQVRRVARGLSPIQTEPEGLMHALQELASQTKEFFGVHCAFERRRPVPVHGAEVAAHLFRIAQESVNNALKHAAPRTITIRLNRARNRITLTVADDGRGIGPIPPVRSGLGLRIMQYRCSLIQGTLTVRRKKRGTEVVCSAPCPKAADVKHRKTQFKGA